MGTWDSKRHTGGKREWVMVWCVLLQFYSTGARVVPHRQASETWFYVFCFFSRIPVLLSSQFLFHFFAFAFLPLSSTPSPIRSFLSPRFLPPLILPPPNGLNTKVPLYASACVLREFRIPFSFSFLSPSSQTVLGSNEIQVPRQRCVRRFFSWRAGEREKVSLTALPPP